MCRKAMDLKPKHHFKSELRRIVGPRLGLRLLRVAVEQDTGHTHWRSSLLANSAALKKYFYKAKKRAHLVKLAKHAKEGENMEEKQSVRLEDDESQLLQPAGAMAPRNTTQYLMDNVYEDYSVSSFPTDLQQSEPHSATQNTDSAWETSYDECISFQQRDFDAQYGALW